MSIDSFRARESTRLPCPSSPSQKSRLSSFRDWCTSEYCLPRSTVVLPKALADGWRWPLGGGQDRNVSARHDSCQPVNVTVAQSVVYWVLGEGKKRETRSREALYMQPGKVHSESPQNPMERVARDSVLGKRLVRRSRGNPLT